MGAAGEIHLLGALGQGRTDDQETREICHQASNQDLVSPSFSGGSGVKHMAPHSSALAWKTPWMEEAGGLPSMGSLKVGHD